MSVLILQHPPLGVAVVGRVVLGAFDVSTLGLARSVEVSVTVS